MDGNGRWAELRGLPRVEGHKQGAARAKEIIRAAKELGIRVLTLYVFSLENWQRPQEEVQALMKLLELYLTQETENLKAQGIAFRAIGDLERLPRSTQEVIRSTEAATREGKAMVLVGAISYGGRDEILRAVRKALQRGLRPQELGEQDFASLLDTAGLPEPDLIIRTSGEQRLSNFLLWQSAYAELYFTPTLWPDFHKEELKKALQDYQRRQRRFGAVKT
jgi:undecaprenyl diphosphate synthase